MTVTLPAALLVLDFYPLRRLGIAPGQWHSRTALQVWLEKIPFFLVSVADGCMTLYISLGKHVAETLQETGWVPRITITIYDLAFYLLKTVVPFHLSPFYPITAHKVDPSAMPFLLSLAVVIAITAAAIRWRHQAPALLAVWIVYSIAVLPVSGILHNGRQIAADRYTYLPCLGWALLAGYAVSAAWRWTSSLAFRKGLVAGLAALLLALLVWRTERQLALWHDTETLWTKAIADEPSAFALANLGTTYFEEGDDLGAVDLFRRAIAMEPRYGVAHFNLAGAYLDLRRFDDALREFRITQQLQPDFAPAYDGSGNALSLEGKLDEAIRDYRRAVQMDPESAKNRHNLETALARQRHGSVGAQ